MVEDGAGAGAEGAFWLWGALASGAVGPITDRLMDHLCTGYRRGPGRNDGFGDEVSVIYWIRSSRRSGCFERQRNDDAHAALLAIESGDRSAVSAHDRIDESQAKAMAI